MQPSLFDRRQPVCKNVAWHERLYQQKARIGRSDSAVPARAGVS